MRNFAAPHQAPREQAPQNKRKHRLYVDLPLPLTTCTTTVPDSFAYVVLYCLAQSRLSLPGNPWRLMAWVALDPGTISGIPAGATTSIGPLVGQREWPLGLSCPIK